MDGLRFKGEISWQSKELHRRLNRGPIKNKTDKIGRGTYRYDEHPFSSAFFVHPSVKTKTGEPKKINGQVGLCAQSLLEMGFRKGNSQNDALKVSVILALHDRVVTFFLSLANGSVSMLFDVLSHPPHRWDKCFNAFALPNPPWHYRFLCNWKDFQFTLAGGKDLGKTWRIGEWL